MGITAHPFRIRGRRGIGRFRLGGSLGTAMLARTACIEVLGRQLRLGLGLGSGCGLLSMRGLGSLRRRGGSSLCSRRLVGSSLCSALLRLLGGLALGLLGSQARTALGEGLLAARRRGSFCSGCIRVVIVFRCSCGGGFGLRRVRGGSHGIHDLGLHDVRQLLLRLAELAQRAADGAAHLRKFIGTKEQKGKHQDDYQLCTANTRHELPPVIQSVSPDDPGEKTYRQLQQYTAPVSTAKQAREMCMRFTGAMRPQRLPRRGGYAPVMPISLSTPSSCATRMTLGWAFTTSKPFWCSTAWCAAPTNTPMPVESM